MNVRDLRMVPWVRGKPVPAWSSDPPSLVSRGLMQFFALCGSDPANPATRPLGRWRRSYPILGGDYHRGQLSKLFREAYPAGPKLRFDVGEVDLSFYGMSSRP